MTSVDRGQMDWAPRSVSFPPPTAVDTIEQELLNDHEGAQQISLHKRGKCVLRQG